MHCLGQALGGPMKRREFVALLSGTMVMLPPMTSAQQPTNKVFIGFLSANSHSAMKARTDAFQQGLRELGYIDGGNISVEYKFAGGNSDRLRALTDELVRLNVRVIVT